MGGVGICSWTRCRATSAPPRRARPAHAGRLHRDRGWMGCHRGRPAAMDYRRHHANGGRGDANARALCTDDGVRADLRGPCNHRRDLDRFACARDDVIGLPELIAGVIGVALNAYALTGGADFGGGVWDRLATGVRRERQRELIAESIAPIWEANHVWLIVVVVVFFTAFPGAFSTLGTVLHIPLTLMLIGIVLRGSAFVFRSYGPHGRSRWGLAFAVASVITPVLLGTVIGSIASGAVATAAEHVRTSSSFTEIFIKPWTARFPVAVGAFA